MMRLSSTKNANSYRLSVVNQQRQFREKAPTQRKKKEYEQPRAAAIDPSEPDRNGDERAQRAYWCKWKESAQKAAKTHWGRSRAAWSEYLMEEPEVRGAADLTFRYPRKFPIYWSSVKLLQPSYYSRTPVPVVKQTFDNRDSVARVAATLCDRLGRFMLSRTPYDEAMESVRDQFILTDKAAGRVYFEPEIEPTMDRIALQVGADGMSLVDQLGQPPQGDVLQDDSGYYYERPGERLVTAQIHFSALDYDEVLHTPFARNWSEITEIAYRVVLSKTEAREKFGDKIDTISFVQRKDTRKDNRDDEAIDLPELYVEVWEIWDKEKKQVLWYCDSYEEGMLRVEQDLYNLDGFFPQTEFVLGTKPAKSLYPTPWHTQVASTISQLHNIWNRLFRLINAVRRRAVADASIDALISAINDASELEVIAVQNFRDILEKNGIGNLIQYIPVAELVAAIGELNSLITSFKEQFNEFTAIPDVVRGTSTNAMEGVGTQQLKGQFASVRFSNDQRKIQNAALNALELMIDLALKKLPVQVLTDVTGANFLPDADRPFVPAALNLLKQDRKRIIRIEIETDSTSYLNDQVNAAQRNETAQTVMNGLQQVGQIAQAQPEFAGVALQTLLFALRGLAQGKSFEGEVAQAVTALIQKVSQPPQPPPDYEGQKLAIQQQELDLKGRVEMARFQLEQIKLSNDKLRLDMDQSLSITKYQLIDGPRLQLEYQKEKNATDLRIQELQMQLTEATTTAQREQIKLEQKAVQDNFDRFAESQRLAIEQQFSMLSEREKMIEENRLRNEQTIEMLRLSLQQQQPAQAPAPQAPPVVNIIQQEKPREVVLERLADGSLVGRTRDVQF